MCELFGLSARFPTDVHFSLNELAAHGGGTGPHRDGWGIAFLRERDLFILREPEPAHESPWVSFLQTRNVRASTVVAHIRKATVGLRVLRNTQPFSRELGGHMHVFAHNGTLHSIHADPRFESRRFRPVGDTDSEHAFVALLDRLAPLWNGGVPSLDARLEVLVPFAHALATLGQANFIYSDGDATFAHGHKRADRDGIVRAPGLHFLCRHCNETESDGFSLSGVSIGHVASQDVALVASVPLSAEHWEPFREGELVVMKDGKVVRRIAGSSA